ncbi:MAG TPA: EVE domain-containing protein, partial [Ktedonobacterales bacterium]
MSSRELSYWAFMSNPDRYRIEEAVRDLARDSWATKGSHVRAGDRAIIWKARGRSKTRGIIAQAEILTDPVPSTNLFGSEY